MNEWFFTGIYECDDCDNLFVPEKLKKIAEVDKKIREMPEWKNICYATSTQDSSCNAAESYVSPVDVLFGGYDAV